MLLTAFVKQFFIWHFILNEKHDLLLTISYQKPFVVSFPLLCFQIHVCTAKFILWPEMGQIFLALDKSGIKIRYLF